MSLGAPHRETDRPDIAAQLETQRPGRQPRRGLQRLLARAIEVVGLVLFVAMMVATLLQVLARYIEVAIPWTEEFAGLAFLAAIMLGIALATYARDHIVVDFVYAKLPPRGQSILSLLFGLAILALLATWLRGAWRLWEVNTGATFVTMPAIPVSWLYAVEATALVLMILFIATDMHTQVRRLRGKT